MARLKNYTSLYLLILIASLLSKLIPSASGDTFPVSSGYGNPLSLSSTTVNVSSVGYYLSPSYETYHNARHVGEDYMAAAGSPVYAISDGIISEFSNSGSATTHYIIVRHNSGPGFFAIYGHVTLKSGLASSSGVAKGDIIGYIANDGTNSHIHFGINLSSSISEFKYGNYGWGRVPLTTTNNFVEVSLGWRSPISWLSSNPANVIPYVPSAAMRTLPDLGFDWSDVTGASAYRIQISTNPSGWTEAGGFSNGLVVNAGLNASNNPDGSGGLKSSYIWNSSSVGKISNPIAGQQYWWSVRADVGNRYTHPSPGGSNPYSPITALPASSGTYDLRQYSSISANPNPIVQGQPVTVNVNVANLGSAGFNGSFRAALLNSGGVFQGVLGTSATNVSAGISSGLTFSTGSAVQSAPGSYKVELQYQASGSSSWLAVPSGSYTNPINISIISATDTTAPSLSISSPSNGASFSGSTITMSGTASDNVGVSQVQYRVNSGSWSTASGTTSWSASVTLSPGSNTLEARAIDTSGNPSSIQSRSVTYNAPDTTAPSLSISSPSNGASFSGSTISMSGTSSDNVAVSYVQYRVNSGSWSTASGATSWSASVTLSPGSNTLEARAIDTSGNPSVIQSRSVTYNAPDTTSPSLSISSPSNGASFSGSTISMSGSASDNVGVSQVQYRVNSGSWSAASGTTSWSASVTLSPGSNTLEARAIDTSGNPSSIQSRSVTYNAPDTTAPSLSISSPSNGSSFSGSTITMSGTASDNVGVFQVQYRVNSGTWSTASGTTSWSASVTLSPGSNTLEARAIDTSGNPSAIQSRSVTYNSPDTTAPSLSISFPSQGEVFSIAGLLMEGTASDNVGVLQVQYRVNSGTWSTASGTTSWSALVTLSPGNNFLEARAYDTSGNPSAIANRTVNYNPPDTTAPSLSISSPSNGAVFSGSAITMTGTASDNFGVSQVHYRVNSGTWFVASGSTSWSASVTLSPGSNVVEAMALDTSGNPSTIASRTVTYNPSDTTTPTLTITSPTNGAAFSGSTITMTGTASDNVGVSQVHYRVNSGTWFVASGSTSWSASVTLSPGSNVVEAMALDTSGNPSAIASRTVTYNPSDTTVPILTITSPSNGAAFSGSTITMTGTASDNIGVSQVHYRVNSGSWSTASGATSWSASVTLFPGTNLLEARAFDISGNPSSIASRTVTYNPPDTTAPILNITAPSNGAVYSGSAITMTGTASDNIGVTQVHYRVNSGSWFVASGSTSWSASVSLSPGTNVLEARAFDTSGNPSSTVSRTVTYNSPSGSVRISNDETWGGLSGSVGTTLFFVIDVPAGRRTLRIETFGGTGDADLYVRYGSQPTTVTYDKVSGGGTSTESIVIDNPAAGDYHIMVRSFSDTTNVSLRASYSAAASPPALRIYGPRNIRTSRASLALRGTATDPDGDLAWVKFRVSGPWRTASGLASWSANAVLKPGNNRIQVEAGDSTGRRSPVQQVRVFRR
ncbi:MAG: peptidoglycan DD-metalloendopeptidase family protein [Verrucomicrobiales bacterium]|nr:peptidoglycan DD-metalloendopeptidase family protein [Verrucomicrobiales bacterium]